MLEESFQIHFPAILGVFAEPDGMDQIGIGKIRLEKRSVYTAKINEVQTTSCHDEKCFVVRLFTRRCEIREVRNMSAVTVQIELADADQLLVHLSCVCHTFDTVGNATACAGRFLFDF